MLNKSLIQFYVDGQGCVPSLLFDLRPNYGGGNEDNGDFLQKVPPAALPHSMPWTLQQATIDPASVEDSLTLTEKSGSGSCQVAAPFSWVLVRTRFYVPSKSLFPQSCVSSGSSVVGLMATSFKRAYSIPRSAAPRAPAPVAGHC